MKERIEYIITNIGERKVFVGRSVNYNVCGQAYSLDELERKMKVMVNSWLKHGMDTMNKTEPFELKEVTKEEWESEYAEWMKTSNWINIADALYNTIRDLVGDNWDNSATEMYEKNTTRKIINNNIK